MRPTRSQVEYRRAGGRSPVQHSRSMLSRRGATPHAHGRRTVLRRRIEARCRVQRRHWPELFVFQSQPFAAGGNDLDCVEHARIASIMSAAASSRCSQLSKISSRATPLQRVGDTVGQSQSRLLGDAEYRRDRPGHGCGVADRRQLDHEHPVGKFMCAMCGHLEGQACLADTSHTRQRDDPVSPEQRPDFGELRLAPYEARAG